VNGHGEIGEPVLIEGAEVDLDMEKFSGKSFSAMRETPGRSLFLR
jgi:hypothetical protein